MQHGPKKLTRGALAGLTIGALGVVYGDIGTSPLYAVNEIFFGHAHVHPSRAVRLKGLLYSLLVNNATPAYEYYGLGDDKRLSAELVPANIA